MLVMESSHANRTRSKTAQKGNLSEKIPTEASTKENSLTPSTLSTSSTQELDATGTSSKIALNNLDFTNNKNGDSMTSQGVGLSEKILTNVDDKGQSPCPSTPSTSLSQQFEATGTSSSESNNPDYSKNQDASPTIASATEQSPSPSSTSTSLTQKSNAMGTNTDALNNPDLNNGLETQCPPKQVMEQLGEEESKYRIPSYVFKKDNTSNQADWSTASNESLFSIQMGNMSFTKDHFLWMSKSGDLDLLNPNITPSMDLSNNQQSTARISIDVGNKAGNLGDRIGETEATAAETMRQVIMENEADKKPKNLLEPNKKSTNLAKANNNSRISDGSVTSFAFPILPGQVDKNASVSAWPKAQKQQVKTCQPSKEPSQSNAKLGSETPKRQTSVESENPKLTTEGDQWKWSCLPCWPFR